MSFNVRSLLEREKFAGPNFSDWFGHLKIVLKAERKLYVLETAVPPQPAVNAARAVRDAYEKYVNDSIDVACLMLASMTPPLQRQHEDMSAIEIIANLKMLYAAQARTERYNLTKLFFQSKLAEGSPVRAHVLKMIGHKEALEKLGHTINQELAVDIILQSLPPSFDAFIINFNMNKIDCTPAELLNMLLTTEETLKGKPSTSILMVPSRNKKKGKKGKAPVKSYSKALKQKVKRSKDNRCFHCGQLGHWKKDCKALQGDKRGSIASGSGTQEKKTGGTA